MNNGKGGIGCGTIIFVIIALLLLFCGDGDNSSSRSDYSSYNHSNNEGLQNFVNTYDYDDFK